MSDRPLVSVVISNWNRLSDVRKCIESIMIQDYENKEIIVIDNCSNDGSIEYLKSLGDKISLCIMPHSDFSAMCTLNCGFSIANGKYTMVMDNDAELVDPESITKLVRIIECKPNVGAISCNVCGDDGYHQMPIRHSDGSEYSDKELHRVYGKTTFNYFEFHGAATLFNSNVLRKMGYYDPDFFIYYNELDLALKMLGNGYEVLYSMEVPAIHHLAMTSRSGGMRTYYAIRNYATCFNRNFHFPQRTIMVACSGFSILFNGIIDNFRARILHREGVVNSGGVDYTVMGRCIYIYLLSIIKSISPSDRNKFNDVSLIRPEFYKAEMQLFRWTMRRVFEIVFLNAIYWLGGNPNEDK